MARRPLRGGAGAATMGELALASPSYEQHSDIADRKHGSDHDGFPEAHRSLLILNLHLHSRKRKTKSNHQPRLSRIVAVIGYHLPTGVAHEHQVQCPRPCSRHEWV